MSTIFNSSSFTNQGAVTQSQLTAATNACVKKSQLTTTGAPSSVPLLDSQGVLSLKQSTGGLTCAATGGVTNDSQFSAPLYITQTTASNQYHYSAIFEGSNPGSSFNGLLIRNIGGVPGATVNLDFLTYQNNNVPSQRIQTLDVGSGLGDLVFYSKSAVAGPLYERLRLTSNGNLLQSTANGSTSFTSGSAGITCNGTLAMGANSITQSSTGAITSGTGGITCNGVLTMGANNINQSGGGFINAGSGGFTTLGSTQCSSLVVGNWAAFTAGTGPLQYQVLANAGTGATATISGNANSGTITLTAGSSAVNGSVLTVYLPSFSTNIAVMVNSITGATIFYTTTSANSFTLKTTANLANAQAYTVTYIALGY